MKYDFNQRFLKYRFLVLILLATTMLVGRLQAQTQDVIEAPVKAELRTLKFGVVPQQSASKLARLWGPILRHISEETGYKILFKTAKNIPTFEKRLLAGDYDLAYMNPYHFTVFNETPGYQALLKQKDKMIQGVVVVQKDSPIQDVTELSGSTLAFPAPAAFAASVLPRAYFHENDISVKPKYVSSHDSVYLAVSKGLLPAGGGVQRTLNKMNPEVKQNLRILWKTQAYTPHAFAVHPRVSAEQSNKIQRAMIAMNDSEEGIALLTKLNFKGIEAAVDSDWDDVRSLGIDLLNSLINEDAE